MKTFLVAIFSFLPVFAQAPAPSPQQAASNTSGGSGTVTSVTIAGTTNQIDVTGTCTGTTTISCTLSIPSGLVLPGTINGLTITTTTGTLTITGAKVLTVNKSLTLDGTDGVTLTFPATSATIARTDAGQTFTGIQAFSSSPTMPTVSQADNSTKGATTAYVDTGLATKGPGTVTSIATTSPVTGGTITGTGTIACATCVAASSPGAGIAHFAGSTQTVTSSAVALGSDVSGTLPVANGGTGTTSTLTGLVRGNASAMTAAELSGDVTTSGSNAATVVKVNGASVPASAAILASNGSSQAIAATTTGSGTTAVLATAPALTAITTDTLTATQNGLATAVTPSATLQNTTAATSGATIQASPSVQFKASAWNGTTANSTTWDVVNYPANASNTSAGNELDFIPTTSSLSNQQRIQFCGVTQGSGSQATISLSSSLTSGVVCVKGLGSATGIGPTSAGSTWATFAGGVETFMHTSNGQFGASLSMLGWAPSTITNNAAADSGLDRDAAGLVGVTNGTQGTTAANYRDMKLRHSVAAGTAPTIASGGGGTASSIAGADQSGTVLVGTSIATGSVVLTFGTAFPYGMFNCSATDQTNDPTIIVTCTTAPYSGLGSGTYTSGITTTGTVGQTCSIAITGGGGTGATATVALTGTNTIAGGTALVVTAAGSGFVTTPTTGTVSAGTASACSGTPVLATVLSTTGLALTSYSRTLGTAVNLTASDAVTWSIPWVH